MASFIAQDHYYPKVGDWVSGTAGTRLVIGKVLPSPSNPRKPAIFSRHGFVGLYVETADGLKRCINNICKVECKCGYEGRAVIERKAK